VGISRVLVNLILTSSSYLRWQRFYRESSRLANRAVPVLAWSSCIIIAGSKIFSNPGKFDHLDLSTRVMAAFAFIISTRPWGLGVSSGKGATFMGQ
jgi:hypothetical protein